MGKITAINHGDGFLFKGIPKTDYLDLINDIPDIPKTITVYHTTYQLIPDQTLKNQIEWVK